MNHNFFVFSIWLKKQYFYLIIFNMLIKIKLLLNDFFMTYIQIIYKDKKKIN